MFGRTLKSRVFHMRNVMNKLPNYKNLPFTEVHQSRTRYWKSSTSVTFCTRKRFYRLRHYRVLPRTSSAGVYEGASAAQFKIELKSSRSSDQCLHVQTG
ncbi:hypothetical protein O9992_23445 [Vibrio lentus]|nr:hypothetical protein [Vibrio lentus]